MSAIGRYSTYFMVAGNILWALINLLYMNIIKPVSQSPAYRTFAILIPAGFLYSKQCSEDAFRTANFIDSIPLEMQHTFATNSKLVMYADNIVLYRPFVNLSDINVLQADIFLWSSWIVSAG